MRNNVFGAVVLALLAIIATPAFAQTPAGGESHDKSGSGVAQSPFASVSAITTDIRVGGRLSVRWTFAADYRLAANTPISLSVVIGSSVYPVASDVAGRLDGGQLVYTIGRLEPRTLETLTAATPAKLRFTTLVDLGAGDPPSPFWKDVDITLKPANRQPVLNGALMVPTEVDGLVDVNVGGNIVDPDGDALRFQIIKHAGDRWLQIASGSVLPLTFRSDVSGLTSQSVEYKLLIEELGTDPPMGNEFPFMITVKATPPPAPAPPLPASSGKPPAAPAAGDPARSAAPAATPPPAKPDAAPIASANHAPRNLRVRVRPENRVVGGTTVGLLWEAEDEDRDALFINVRFTRPNDGVALVMSSTANPFEITTPFVPSERRLELVVSVGDGKSESDRQVIELVLQPVERALVDERQFRDDVRVPMHNMGRRMADAGMILPDAVDYEFYNDENGNMQVRQRPKREPESRDKSASPPKKK